MRARHLGALVLAATAISAAASLAQATVVSPFSTYSFAGQCTDCSGVATASLMLEDYTPGTALDPSEFVSFTYGGSNLLSSYTLTNAFELEGALGVAPGYYNVSIFGYGDQGYFDFTSTTTGSWSTGPLDVADMGGQGTWNNGSTPISAAPEPSTWLLMFAGVTGIGLMLRSAKRNHGFRFKDAFSV
jgi:hypothetical protein